MRNTKKELEFKLNDKHSPYDIINAMREVLKLDPIPGTGPQMKKRKSKSKKVKDTEQVV